MPSRIKLTADYTDEALWDWEGFTGPIDSWSLPLREDLRLALREWARVQGQLAVTDFVWPDATVHANWQRQGFELAARVQAALGADVQVLYFEHIPDDDPFDIEPSSDRTTR